MDCKVELSDSDIYNMIEFKGHQLYFLGTGQIVLYKGDSKLLEYEEKWLSKVESKFTEESKLG